MYGLLKLENNKLIFVIIFQTHFLFHIFFLNFAT